MNKMIVSVMSVDLVIEHKADPNYTDSSKQTPLHFHAARKGQEAVKIVRTLLYNNADASKVRGTQRRQY